MADCETTYATASVVPNKGPDALPVKSGVLFLQALGYHGMVLMTCGEPIIIAWDAAVQREGAEEDTEQRQHLILRQSLRGLHTSNGHAGNMVRAVTGLTRTWRAAVGSRFGCKLVAPSPLAP